MTEELENEIMHRMDFGENHSRYLPSNLMILL